MLELPSDVDGVMKLLAGVCGGASQSAELPVTHKKNKVHQCYFCVEWVENYPKMVFTISNNWWMKCSHCTTKTVTVLAGQLFKI